MSHMKRVCDITKNERGSNPPNKGKEVPPPRCRGKGKRPISERVTNDYHSLLFMQEDEQTL